MYHKPEIHIYLKCQLLRNFFFYSFFVWKRKRRPNIFFFWYYIRARCLESQRSHATKTCSDVLFIYWVLRTKMAATWKDCKPNLCDLTLKSVEKLGFTSMTPVQVCEETYISPNHELFSFFCDWCIFLWRIVYTSGDDCCCCCFMWEKSIWSFSKYSFWLLDCFECWIVLSDFPLKRPVKINTAIWLVLIFSFYFFPTRLQLSHYSCPIKMLLWRL